MKIKYKVEGHLCITECPYEKGVYVGSGACDRCHYSATKHVDGLSGVVDCKFDKAKP